MIETYLHQILAAVTAIKGDIHTFVESLDSTIKPMFKENHEDCKQLHEQMSDKISKVNDNMANLLNFQWINEQSEMQIEEQAYKKRKSIQKKWFHQKNLRKQLLYNLLRDEGTTKVYQKWHDEKQFLPQKFEPKEIQGEPPAQKEIRKQLGYAKMKAEIEVMTERAKKTTNRIKGIDKNMLTNLANIAKGSVLEKLEKIWKIESERGEMNAIKGWEKKEQWLINLSQKT